MTLEEIKKGLDFLNKTYEDLNEAGRQQDEYLLIGGYQKVIENLLKMVEEKEGK